MDVEDTPQTKFEQPHVLVEVSFLEKALTLSRAGCPLDFCLKPFVSHSIRCDGAAAKAVFVCKKGHETTWTSCDQIGRQALLLNRLIPCAAVMAGLKIVPMKRFLGLLHIETQGSSYMKVSALDLLARLTNVMYQDEIRRVREEMLESDTFSLGM